MNSLVARWITAIVPCMALLPIGTPLAHAQDGVHDFDYDPLTGIVSVRFDPAATVPEDGLWGFLLMSIPTPYQFPPGAPTAWYDNNSNGFLELLPYSVQCNGLGSSSSESWLRGLINSDSPIIQVQPYLTSWPYHRIGYITAGYFEDDGDCGTPPVAITPRETVWSEITILPEPGIPSVLLLASALHWLRRRPG